MACLGDQLGMEFSPQEIEDCHNRKGLLSLELELSRVCNLRCVYCYAASGVPLENELSYDELVDVIDQAIGLGVKKIIVLGGGEPLLYPHLLDILKYIRANNLVADLFTNGMTLTSELVEELYRLEVGVVLKMNSRNPEVQDYLAGREGAFLGIENALQLLEQGGYPDEKQSLGIESIICNQNYDEIPDLWRWARGKGVMPYIEAMTMQGRAKDHLDLEVEPAKVKELFEELSRIDREEFGCEWEPHPPLVSSQCARHEYSCTVTSIGDVWPCPGVSINVGNIREQKLPEILQQSDVIQELRNIRHTIKGKCACCDLSDHCYGCRGHAYQVSGDYLAEDPLCWFDNKVDKGD